MTVAAAQKNREMFAIKKSYSIEVSSLSDYLGIDSFRSNRLSIGRGMEWLIVGSVGRSQRPDKCAVALKSDNAIPQWKWNCWFSISTQCHIRVTWRFSISDGCHRSPSDHQPDTRPTKKISLKAIMAVFSVDSLSVFHHSHCLPVWALSFTRLAFICITHWCRWLCVCLYCSSGRRILIFN